MDGQHALLFGQSRGARAALEIVVGEPAAAQLVVRRLGAEARVHRRPRVRPHRVETRREKAARLAGPGKQRQLLRLQPRPPLHVRGGDAAGPHRIDHAGEAEVVGHRGERRKIVRLRVGVGFPNPRQRPVRSAERPHATGLPLRVQRVDPLAHRHVFVVAVQEVQIHMVGVHALQGHGELLGHPVRKVRRRVGALADHHHLVAHAAVAQPAAEQPLHAPAGVDVRGVEGVAAVFVVVVEHHRGVLGGGLVVATHHQARNRLLQTRHRAVTHDLAAHGERPAVNGRGLPLLALEGERDAGGRAPAIQRAGVAEAVRPRHAGRLHFAFGERAGHGVHFQDVGLLGRAGHGFARAVAQQVETPTAVRSGAEPRRGDVDGAFRAEDLHRVV